MIMNPLDMAFLGIMGLSLLYSTWKGFVRDVFSLVGILGGFLVAARFYPVVTSWLRAWVTPQWAAALLACACLFLVTFLGISLLGRMLWGSLKLLGLGWLDRVAGFGFGALKGVILCIGVLAALIGFLPSRTPVLADSRLAPVLVEAAREAGKKLPGQLGQWLRALSLPEKDGGGKQEARHARKGG